MTSPSNMIYLLGLGHIAFALPWVLHALLEKRYSRAAFGWIILVVAVPFIGSTIYLLFGLNRVGNRSRKLLRAARPELQQLDEVKWDIAADEEGADAPFTDDERRLLRAGAKLSQTPLRPGNLVKPLHNGEQAYPPMIEAIRSAHSYVWLTTYIFETNAAGMAFIDALIDAHKRRVDVRVIIDGVGELYHWPLAGKKLRDAGVHVVRYLPPKIFPPQFMLNLRNHRKLLVVDDVVAFTGGMNIGGRHMVTDPNGSQVYDIHFALEGPIIEDFKRVFTYDWVFGCHHDGRLPSNVPFHRIRAREDAEVPRLPAPRTLSAIEVATHGGDGRLASVARASAAWRGRTSGAADALEAAATDAPEWLKETISVSEEELRVAATRREQLLENVRRVYAEALKEPEQIAYDAKNNAHDAWCRLITGGPQDEVSQLETLYSSVLSAADRRILLVSPYFIPTEAIESSLVNAALRGVDVTVLVPEETNQPLVHSAMFRSIGWMIRRGVKVKMQPPPFAHTKLLLIDDRYVQIGSANMDPRSLRLNFELSVEIMDESLVQQLDAYYAPVLARSRPLTLEDLNKRPLIRRVIDGAVWLFSPYL